MLNDLREILNGIVPSEDLEKAIKYCLENEEYEEDIPFIEVEEDRVRCNFIKGNREITITIQDFKDRYVGKKRYYCLEGSTWHILGKSCEYDGIITDYETRIDRFKEDLERYIEYGIETD